jgi:hypothetical protein
LSGAMSVKPTSVLGSPRLPDTAGSLAVQLSAMNSCQAKIARSWMLAADPAGTSCGTLGLMKFVGSVTC